MNLKLQNGTMLPLMEDFYSIQGEGFYSGSPAYFLRIGGCDVGCSWCDVKESWDAHKHPLTEVDVMISKILKYPCDTVVVTGGEPLMWDMTYLTQSLREKKINTHLETSGSHKLTGDWDWICLSPKKWQKPLLEIIPFVNELKIIIKNKHDFIWAEEQKKNISKICKPYLQPEWNKKEKIMPTIVDYVMKNPEWNISLQTHKYLQIP